VLGFFVTNGNRNPETCSSESERDVEWLRTPEVHESCFTSLFLKKEHKHYFFYVKDLGDCRLSYCGVTVQLLCPEAKLSSSGQAELHLVLGLKFKAW